MCNSFKKLILETIFSLYQFGCISHFKLKNNLIWKVLESEKGKISIFLMYNPLHIRMPDGVSYQVRNNEGIWL